MDAKSSTERDEEDGEMVTWDLDALDSSQRKLLADLLDADGSTFVHYDSPGHIAGRELRKLGIVDIDGDIADDVAVALTDSGRRWVESLPPGSLRSIR